jgi:hypothetical protein
MKWEKFINKLGPSPTSSAPFWKKINFHKKKQNSVKTLVHKNQIYHTNAEKASLFADILATTFSDNNNVSNQEPDITSKLKERIDKYKNERKSEIINLISKPELDKSIKDLNNKTSSGLDSICNLILKKLPEKFKNLLLKLFNKTLIESKIPQEWKLSEITMIPKKNIDLDDPKSYRPISMTSCIARLCEKTILTRIKNFLKTNKIIIKQQSGFRQHRQTKDNLIFLIQKIQESFVRKKSNRILL